MTILFAIFKLIFTHLEHKKINFDIGFYEFCLHRLTNNQEFLPFMRPLRKGKYSNKNYTGINFLDRYDDVIDFEEYDYRLTEKQIKEILVEIHDTDKKLDAEHDPIYLYFGKSLNYFKLRTVRKLYRTIRATKHFKIISTYEYVSNEHTYKFILDELADS